MTKIFTPREADALLGKIEGIFVHMDACHKRIQALGEELPAHDALQHAHELNPSDSGTVDLLYAASLSLGRKAQAGGRFSDALRYYGEAAGLRPAEPAPHREMGKIYTLTGRRAEAKAEEEAAGRLGKSLPSR